MMVRGNDFEVSKEVFDRAQANRGYMAGEDIRELFDDSILCGYGLYDCRVKQDGDKYICTWWHGSSCD